MVDDSILTNEQLQQELTTLPGWEIRDGWLRRQYKTPGFPHTIMLVNTIGYVAEAAWHHPDVSVGYAQVTVSRPTVFVELRRTTSRWPARFMRR